MKIKNSKIIGVLLTLVVLASLTAGLVVPAAAQGPQNVWATVSAVGDVGRQTAGNAPLVAGPGPMEKAIDGTLYAYCWDVPPGPVTSYLKKSPNGGHSWMGCSTVTDDLPNLPIVAIACSPEDANTLYVACNDNNVYRSQDAGGTFNLLSAIPFDANETISCMTVGYSGGTHWIIVGTNDAGGDDGEVYMKSDLFGSLWNAQGIDGVQTVAGAYDVFAIAASPGFTTEANPQIVAVVSSAANTYVSFQYGAGAWNSGSTPDVELQFDPVPTSFGGLRAADIAFPADYNSSYPTVDLLVGVDDWGGPGGDVYRVYPVIAYDQDIAGANSATMINSVAVAGNSGSCKLLATGSGSNNVWHSENDSLSWLFSLKGVAVTLGGSLKYVTMADDYATSGIAQVATSTAGGGIFFDEASVAGTADFGISWTDYGCINTNIMQITNMDVSPAYSTDNTMFLITAINDPVFLTGLDSLWKYDGTFWTRVATLPIGNAFGAGVQCSPNYTVDNAVFLADTVINKIFRATDGGTWFLPQVGAPPAFAGGWQVIDDSHLVVGEVGVVAYTQNNGTTFIPSAPLPGPPNVVVSFALSADGSTLLAGGNNSGVYKSDDAGLTWGGAAPPFIGGMPGGAWLNVAFDPNDPMTIYAADAVTNGVYRLTFPGDTMWRRIDGLPIVNWPGPSTAGGAFNANALVPGMQVAPDGAMYVADAAGGGLGADSFAIIAGGPDTGNLFVTSGAVAVTTFGAATFVGGVWTAFAAGDGILVTAVAPNTFGTWTQTGTVPTTANIVTDVDGDASCMLNFIPVSGTYSLPDAAGGAGAAVVLRSINTLAPVNSPLGVYFESMATGFTGVPANLVGVWFVPGSNKVFVLESAVAPPAGTGSNVWVYDDSLSVPVNQSDPPDGTDTGRTSTAALSWTALPDCPEYEIWVATNPAFSPILIDGFSNTTGFMATGLEDGITYYWRVCSAASNAATPGRALSPWSSDWSFTTGLAAAEWNPFSDAENVAPAPGATGVPLSPAFQWNPADWATGYEFVLADNPAFTAPLAEETVTSPVYLYSGTLAYSTTYYWKVRAVSATSESVWATGTFTTMDEPAPPPPVTTVPPPQIVTEEITPAWIWAIVIIGAILVIAVIVLIVMTRRVP